MARRARTYTRDNRGRFASSPGGGPKAKPKPRTSFRQRQAVSLARSRGQTGRLGSATKAAKARLKATKARTGAGASPQQKAALTRAKRMASMLAGERRVKTAGKAGVIKGRVRRDPGVKTKLAKRSGKPPGWMQSQDARNLRIKDATVRKELADRLRKLPRVARQSVLKKPTKADSIDQERSRSRSNYLENLQREREAAAASRLKGSRMRPRRLVFTRVYHGTSAESAKAITAGGYKETLRGLHGPGVYGSTSRKVAREYAYWRAAGSPDMTRKNNRKKVKQNSGGGTILTHRLLKSRLAANTEKLSGAEQRAVVRGGRGRVLGSMQTGKEGSFVIMSADLANKTLIKPNGILRDPRIGRPRRKLQRPRRRKP